MVVCLFVFSNTGTAVAKNKFEKEVEKEQGAVKLVREVQKGGYDVVTTDELKQWIDEKKDILIIDTMPYDSSYKKSHIPDAKQFLFPIPAMIEWDTKETAEKFSVPFVDQSAAFTGRRDLFRESIHMTPEGTEMKARLFFKKIVQMKLLED